MKLRGRNKFDGLDRFQRNKQKKITEIKTNKLLFTRDTVLLDMIKYFTETGLGFQRRDPGTFHTLAFHFSLANGVQREIDSR